MTPDLAWASAERMKLIAGAQELVEDLKVTADLQRDSIIWFLRYQGPGETEALQIAAAEYANLAAYPRIRDIALEFVRDAFDQELDDAAAASLVAILHNQEMDQFFSAAERVSADRADWRKRYITSS